MCKCSLKVLITLCYLAARGGGVGYARCSFRTGIWASECSFLAQNQTSNLFKNVLNQNSGLGNSNKFMKM